MVSPVTIILSVVTAEYAVQVSDRLLTQEVTINGAVRYNPWVKDDQQVGHRSWPRRLIRHGLHRPRPHLWRHDGRVDRGSGRR
jgi:hypothetical protein